MDSRYVSVLAFAMRGKLLDKRALEDLTDSKSLDDLVLALRATHYSETMSELSPPLSARRIEQALRRYLYRYHYSLIKYTSWNSAMVSLFERYLVRELKSAVRGVVSGMVTDELLREIDFTPAELTGRRDLLARTAACRSATELPSALRGTDYERPVRTALEYFERTGDLAAIDMELDKVIAGSLTESIRRLRQYDRRWMKWMTDRYLNSIVVEAVLRAKAWRLEPREIRRAIEGIRTDVPRAMMDVLLESADAESISRALKVLEGKGIPPISERANLNAMASQLRERAWRDLVSRAQRAFLLTDSHIVLSVASIFLLEDEVSRLTSVATGIEMRLPREEILEVVLF
ncbi:MAG: V-type ATPase subunit [Aigarchaeota archaeon]|nr:V-type ATPase subunit [Aigarchaeota archaeon]MCS7118112.1 V-type ATPase subunit [Candidatus Calditenuaceae archaeon]MDW8042121.1 V-type ATPase subunit [Nitrososphaerota archaeon]